MKKKNRILIYSFIIMGGIIIFSYSCKKKNETPPTQTPTTVTDIDGNVYHTVTIGTQVWMVENLKTTKYRDGSAIPNITDGIEWSNLTTGAYCNYNNDINNSITYGRLYNWYTVNDSRKIAPTGWHVPSDAEWTQLTDYLGGEPVAGGKLKEAGTTHWNSPNTGADNSSGYSALPGGCRYVQIGANGVFTSIGSYGYWWRAPDGGAGNAWGREMGYDVANLGRNYTDEIYGFSVRCLRD